MRIPQNGTLSMKKKTILVLSDHPFSPSGVGTQTKYVIEALLKTDRYRVVCFGGAIKHADYSPRQVEGWGEDWVIHPVKGYGTPDLVRSVFRSERPDVVWFMTDPRFWEWLWQMDNEIRALAPMVYYHVWDNYPFPMFNKTFYDSNDLVVAISKVTHDIVQNVSPDVESKYLPHAVNSEIFKPIPDEEVARFTDDFFKDGKDKTIFFWNNRNARRKQSGTLIVWFKEFLDIVGHDQACLLMHTDARDPHGQDLPAIIERFGLLENKQVQLSEEKLDAKVLSFIYNMADCTINISDAEGFGLATLESLSCGTPIIVNMTGGLQEQVTDGNEWFGVGIEPTAKAVIGSLNVPYIYEDRISKEDFINALIKIHNMSKSERKELGSMGRQHVLKNYNFDDFCNNWVETIDEVCEKHGSWETRKGYNRWKLMEIK